MNVKPIAPSLFTSILLLLPLGEAAAQTALWTPPADVPRECTISAGTGSVRILAGPDASQASGLAAIFPVPEPCPAPHTGMCQRWDYEWIYSGLNPSHSVLSVDTDIMVVSAAPTAVPSAPPGGDSSTGGCQNAGGEVCLRFNANSETFFATYWTPLNVVSGSRTAGFQSGNRKGFCSLAGADGTIGDPQLSTTNQITTTTLGCTVVWTLSADGCPVAAETFTPGCTIKHTDLGLATNTASCATELNVPGSEQVCRWNSLLRTYTCVTVQ